VDIVHAVHIVEASSQFAGELVRQAYHFVRQFRRNLVVFSLDIANNPLDALTTLIGIRLVGRQEELFTVVDQRHAAHGDDGLLFQNRPAGGILRMWLVSELLVDSDKIRAVQIDSLQRHLALAPVDLGELVGVVGVGQSDQPGDPGRDVELSLKNAFGVKHSIFSYSSVEYIHPRHSWVDRVRIFAPCRVYNRLPRMIKNVLGRPNFHSSRSAVDQLREQRNI